VLATNIVDKEFKKIGFSDDGELRQSDTPSGDFGLFSALIRKNSASVFPILRKEDVSIRKGED